MLNLLVASTLTTHYVSLGAMASSYDGYNGGGMNIEGGLGLGDLPVGIHGAVGFGRATSSANVEDSMTMERLSLGLEGRYCILRGQACAIGGLDLGAQGAYGDLTAGAHDPYMNPPGYHTWEDVSHLVALPRAGVVVGGEHVAFVATVEVAENLASHRERERFGDGGVTGTAGVMYRW